MIKKLARIVLPLIWIAIGILIGGFLFTDVQPRSILAITKCQDTCLKPNEITGLLGAIGTVNASNLFPAVALETDKTIALNLTESGKSFHYVIIPKKDIKNAGEIAAEDTPYLVDAYAVMQELIRQHHLERYRIYTNGPDFQSVAYLHFHLKNK